MIRLLRLLMVSDDVSKPLVYCGPAKFWYLTELVFSVIFRWSAVFLITVGVLRLSLHIWPTASVYVACGHVIQMLSGLLTLVSQSHKFHYDRIQRRWWSHLGGLPNIY